MKHVATLAVLLATTPLHAQTTQTPLAPTIWLGLAGGYYTVETDQNYDNGPGFDIQGGYMSLTGLGLAANVHVSFHAPDETFGPTDSKLVSTNLSVGPKYVLTPGLPASVFVSARALFAYRVMSFTGRGKYQERFGGGVGVQLGVTAATDHGFWIETAVAYDTIFYAQERFAQKSLGPRSVTGSITSRQWSLTLAILVPVGRKG